MVVGAAGHVASTVRKRDECGCSACFYLYIQPTTPARGMVLLVSRVGLPSSVKLLLEAPPETHPGVLP